MCALPRAKPTADGVCPFRAQYGAWSGDTMNMYLAYCRRIVNDYSLSGRIKNPTGERFNHLQYLAILSLYLTNPHILHTL